MWSRGDAWLILTVDKEIQNKPVTDKLQYVTQG
jgi:hypothetical protein